MLTTLLTLLLCSASSAIEWISAGMDESCTQACANHGSVCDGAEICSTDTSQKFLAAFGVPQSSCMFMFNSLHGYGPYTMAVVAGSSYICYHPEENTCAANMACGSTVSAHQMLCACVATATTSKTTTTSTSITTTTTTNTTTSTTTTTTTTTMTNTTTSTTTTTTDTTTTNTTTTMTTTTATTNTTTTTTSTTTTTKATTTTSETTTTNTTTTMTTTTTTTATTNTTITTTTTTTATITTSETTTTNTTTTMTTTTATTNTTTTTTDTTTTATTTTNITTTTTGTTTSRTTSLTTTTTTTGTTTARTTSLATTTTTTITTTITTTTTKATTTASTTTTTTNTTTKTNATTRNTATIERSHTYTTMTSTTTTTTSSTTSITTATTASTLATTASASATMATSTASTTNMVTATNQATASKTTTSATATASATNIVATTTTEQSAGTVRFQGNLSLTMSKDHAAELTKNLTMAKIILAAAITDAADLQHDSKVTFSSISVDGEAQGRRLLRLPGTSKVQAQYQIEDAKPTTVVKVHELGSAVEIAAKANGIEVAVEKVDSHVVLVHDGDEQRSMEAGLASALPVQDQASSLGATVVFLIALFSLVIFCVIGCLTCYWCLEINKANMFEKAVPMEKEKEDLSLEDNANLDLEDVILSDHLPTFGCAEEPRLQAGVRDAKEFGFENLALPTAAAETEEVV